MGLFLLWYVSVSVLGLVTFPLARRLFPALPDRGYAFSRSLGLLGWGYLFWLMGSLHLVNNNIGGQLLALAVIAGLSAYLLKQAGWEDLRAWWRANRAYITGVELLFLGAFGFWALVRAAYPDIMGTEKPMEIGFINMALRSPGFPPQDPWLSGYGISYYYFGYVLMAMLARLTGTPAHSAFNLGISLVYGLSAVGVYGLVYNLLGVRLGRGSPPRLWASLALLGPVFILLVSNLGGVLEVAHARGLFWRETPTGMQESNFWTWLDIQDLKNPPAKPYSWEPRQYGTGGWWWWRSSRVLTDYRLDDQSPGTSEAVEIIDEFPVFSYLLGDLHPHVLAMPFAFLGMAVGFNLLVGGAAPGLSGRRLGFKDWFYWDLGWEGFGLAVLVAGGLAFLNLWDFPMYVALFAGAYTARRAKVFGWNWERAGDFTSLGLAIGIAGIVAYLPFYLGFASQAGGLMPSLAFFTRGAHLWVMFGTLLVPLAFFLAFLWRRHGDGRALVRGLGITALVVAAFVLVTTLLVLLIANLNRLAALNAQAGIAEELFLGSLFRASSWSQLISVSLQRRFEAPGGWLTLAALLLAVSGLLTRTRKQDSEAEARRDDRPAELASPDLYALLLVLLGTLLVFAPEFFFLRDLFASRMNTIFKFYFQAWLLWGAAAAYGSAVLLVELRRASGLLFQIALTVVIAAGMVYTVLFIWDRASGFQPVHGFSFNGGGYIERYAPDEWAAIEFLRLAPAGVIVEAVGGQYTDFGRVAVFSGQAAVLGWEGHEHQWRGGFEETGSRRVDIERLYTTRFWSEAAAILHQYNVRYVIIGPRERATYPVNEEKFQRYLTPVFQQGSVTIYSVSSAMTEADR